MVLYTEVEIHLGGFSEYKELEAKGYECFNVVGIIPTISREENANVQRIRGVNSWNYRHDYDAKDYASASLGYEFLLDSITESIVRQFKIRFRGKERIKVAFLGFDNYDGYCFRYVFYNWFMRMIPKYIPKYKVVSVVNNGLSFDTFQVLGYTDVYYNQADFIHDLDWVKEKLLENKWIFAKTMPNNPHEYTLRRDWDSKDDFLQVVQYIRTRGRLVEAFKTYWRTLEFDGYQYWTCSCDNTNEVCDLINRAKIKE